MESEIIERNGLVGVVFDDLLDEVEGFGLEVRVEKDGVVETNDGNWVILFLTSKRVHVDVLQIDFLYVWIYFVLD